VLHTLHAFLQVFDSNKRLLYTGDAIPEEVSLAKGDYTARVMMRHDQISLLDKMKGTCLVRPDWHALFCCSGHSARNLAFLMCRMLYDML
jgi:hypothetical protein